MELLYESPSYAILGKREVKFNVPPRYVRILEFVAYQPPSLKKDHPLKKNYQRYLLNMETGELRELGHKKVIELASDKKEIKRFIRVNKLRFNTTDDYIAVLDKYHRLTK